MTFRAIVLDFDGLVIDSETPLLEIWQEIYDQHGGSLTLELWQHALGTQHGFDPYAELERQTGAVLERERWVEHVRREHWSRCRREGLQPGVLARLDEARELGLGAAVASSSGRQWVLPWLACHDLGARVSVVCTRDDVTHVKPAPDLFLLAAERLRVPPAECVVFEDSPNGLVAARAAGMWTVAVPRGLTRTLPFPEPDLIVGSLEELTLAELQTTLARRADHSPRSTSTGSVRMARLADG